VKALSLRKDSIETSVKKAIQPTDWFKKKRLAARITVQNKDFFEYSRFETDLPKPMYF